MPSLAAPLKIAPPGRVHSDCSSSGLPVKSEKCEQPPASIRKIDAAMSFRAWYRELIVFFRSRCLPLIQTTFSGALWPKACLVLVDHCGTAPLC